MMPLKGAQDELARTMRERAREELAIIAMHQTRELENLKRKSSAQVQSVSTADSVRMIRQVSERSQQMQSELTQAEMNLVSRTNELTLAKNQIVVLSKQLKESQERNAILEKEKCDRMQELQDCQSQLDSLKADNKKLSSERDEAMNKLNQVTLQMQNEKLKQQRQLLQKQQMKQLQQQQQMKHQQLPVKQQQPSSIKDPRTAAKRCSSDALPIPLPNLDAKRAKLSEEAKNVKNRIVLGSSQAKKCDKYDQNELKKIDQINQINRSLSKTVEEKTDQLKTAKQTEERLQTQLKELQQQKASSTNRIDELTRNFASLQKALKAHVQSLLLVTPLGQGASAKQVEAFRRAHPLPEDNRLFNALQRLPSELSSSTNVSPARLATLIEMITTALLDDLYGFHRHLKDAGERIRDLHSKLKEVDSYNKQIDDALNEKDDQVNKVLDKYVALQNDNERLEAEYGKLKEKCQDLMEMINKIDVMRLPTEADSSTDEHPPAPCANCHEKEAELTRLKMYKDREDPTAAPKVSEETIQLRVDLAKYKVLENELTEKLQAQKKIVEESASQMHTMEEQHKTDVGKLVAERCVFEQRVHSAERALGERNEQLDQERRQRVSATEKIKRLRGQIRLVKNAGWKELIGNRLFAQAVLERSSGEDEIARLRQEIVQQNVGLGDRRLV